MSDFKITGGELAGQIEAQCAINLIIDRELGHHSDEIMFNVMEGRNSRAFGLAMRAERRDRL